MSERQAAADALLHADVSEVAVHQAAGLRNHLVGVEEPKEALLKVVGAADATAVELEGREKDAGDWRWAGGAVAVVQTAHRGHDYVPRGCKDVRAVPVLIVALQFPAEVFSG